MVENTSAGAGLSDSRKRRSGRLLLWGIAALLALIGGLALWIAWRSPQAAVRSQPSGQISTVELEERYGLGVRLVGLTAGGGMIDFRLKIIDPAKARPFLQDPANLPIKILSESGVELLAADELEEEIVWEAGGILFMILPNSGGAVRPGARVTITFGEIQLEPLAAQ